ncbi:MAG: hypothetical protein IPN53_04955 [Comamonadaceae bacterium]|nr:hypothetical protein [Comamonadaceae bacterium]
MNSKSRDIPRFLPTLTEVVDPREFGLLQAAPDKPDVARLAELVRQQVWPVLERKLQEECERLVRLMLSEQGLGVSLRMRQEMDLIIQQVVREVISHSETSKNFVE